MGTKPGSTRRKRRTAEEIRALLLDAARREFRQKGYAGATTAAIARTTDVAEIQMFRYFPSKAELFREAVFAPVVDHFRDFSARNAAEAVDTASIRERAAAYVEELQAFLGENAATLVSLFVAQTYAAPPLAGAEPREALGDFFAECAALMGSRAGTQSSDTNPDKVVRVAFAALLGCITYRDWLLSDAADDAGETDAIIREFILAGIAPHSDVSPQEKPR